MRERTCLHLCRIQLPATEYSPEGVDVTCPLPPDLMKMLKGKLYQAELDKRQEVATAAHAQKKKIEWGSQIRNYVLHPYKLVKDVRTGFETGNTDAMLNGYIDGFLKAFLMMSGQDQTSQEL